MIHVGHVLDTLKQIPDNSVHCCWTSPPYYGLRSYGTAPQIWDDTSDYSVHYHTFDTKGFCGCGAWQGHLGLEPTPELFVKHLTDIFREVRRTLHPSGVCWVNIGDSYKNKNLIGIPWMTAFALRADGWYLRSDIIWAKGLSFCPSYVGRIMPESVKDRPNKSHEYMFLLTKSDKYFYDHVTVAEKGSGRIPGNKKFQKNSNEDSLKVRNGLGKQDGLLSAQQQPQMTRNIRTVWTIPVKPFKGAHFATAPMALVEPCIKAGSSEHGVCGECGNPWMRVITKSKPSADAYKLVGGDKDGNYTGQATKPYTGSLAQNASDTKRNILNSMKVVSTTSWKASCDCNASIVPATVLDPFFGAGTTGLAAQQLGRAYVGCELNPDYAKMAQERIDGAKTLYDL